MRSKEILPDDQRISSEELKQMFIDIDAPMEIQMCFINQYKALEIAELEILDYMSRLNLTHQEIYEYDKKVKELEDLLQTAVTDSLDRYGWLCDKYADISWKVEELAFANIKEDGISNGLFRQLVRELLDKEANERYNKALIVIKNCENENSLTGRKNGTIDFGFVEEALKIAAYGTDK